MENLLHSGAADSAPPLAAIPTSITPTPGVQETPATPDATALTQMPEQNVTPTPVTATRVLPPALPNTLGLQPRQRIALQALVSGQGPLAAAQLAGVHPATVFRWRKHDAQFIAAMNAWQAQSAQTAVECLAAANEHAARTILKAVQAGDVRASLAVVKGLGTLAPRYAGPVFALAVQRRLARDGDDARQSMGRLSRERREDLYFRRREEKLQTQQAAARRAEKEAAAERAAAEQDDEIRGLMAEEVAAAQRAADSAAAWDKYFQLYPQIPPLPRPVTSEAIEQSVKNAPEQVTIYPQRVSFTITAITGDRLPLATAIGEYEEITIEMAGVLLNSLPLLLENVIQWDHAEGFAKKLESLGATIELRPGWRE